MAQENINRLEKELKFMKETQAGFEQEFFIRSWFGVSRIGEPWVRAPDWLGQHIENQYQYKQRDDIQNLAMPSKDNLERKDFQAQASVKQQSESIAIQTEVVYTVLKNN